jgi:hypothetical protein
MPAGESMPVLITRIISWLLQRGMLDTMSSTWKLRVKFSIYFLGLSAGLVLVGWILKYAVAGPVVSVREFCTYAKNRERRIVKLLFQDMEPYQRVMNDEELVIPTKNEN